MDEYTKEIYDKMTDLFNKHGMQYSKSKLAYDKLTWARTYLETHGNKPTDTFFIDLLVEAIGDMIDDMNKADAEKSPEQQLVDKIASTLAPSLQQQ